MFRPNDIVPSSGPALIHHDSHRSSHRAEVMAGTRFPSCRQCVENVRFLMLDPARYKADLLIESDPDFGPQQYFRQTA